MPLLLVACSTADEPGPRRGPDPEPVVEGTAVVDDGLIDLADEAFGTVTGPEDHAFAGRTLLVADLDADGRDDLLVSAEGSAPGAFLLHGPLSGDRNLGGADAFVAAEGPFAAGDLDADGWPDLAAPGDGRQRAVDVWRGPLYGEQTDDDAPIGVLDYPGVGADRVPHVADLDHDGHDDLLVGLPSTDPEDVGRTGVRIYLGPLEGEVPPDAHDVSLVDERLSEWAGAALDARHDLDGDGRADLLVSAPALASGPGGAWIASALPVVDTSLEDLLRVDGGQVVVDGPILVAEDLDEDGHADLAAQSALEIHVMVGPFTEDRTLDDAAVTIERESEEALLAAGEGALVVGAPVRIAVPGIDSGRVDLYTTWETGRREAPDVVLVAGSAFNGLGASATLGDLDDDGRTDLALGAPEAFAPYNYRVGVVYLWRPPW